MIIELQTRFNPMMTVYDSEAAPSAMGKALKSILAPVVQVKQGDLTLYSSGDSYEDQSLLYWSALATVLFLGFVGIRRLLR